MIQTPSGALIPVIIKDRLPYIEHYFPTDKQMLEISREEIMTLKNEWVPSKYNDPSDAAKLRLQQIPTTLIEIKSSGGIYSRRRQTKREYLNYQRTQLSDLQPDRLTLCPDMIPGSKKSLIISRLTYRPW